MRRTALAYRWGVSAPAVALSMAPGLALAGDLDASLDLRQRLIEDASSRSILNTTAAADEAIAVSAMVQFRYLLDNQDQQDAQDDLTVGFENSRTRVGLKGTLPDKNLSYFMWFGFTGSGSSLLLDAWAKWQINDDMALRVGQFKLPTWQEWTVSETRQTFVERSVLDARFAQLYSQGVELTWTQDKFRVIGAFSDGLRSWNDNSPGQQWGLSARAELLVEGTFDQRGDFQSFRDEDPSLIFGLAGHIQDGGTLAGAGGASIYTNDTKISQWTADMQWGFGGWSIFAAIIGNYEERPGGVDYDQYGFLAQVQAFVTDDIEIFARYEWGDLDTQAAAFAVANPGATTNEELSLLTVGATRFFAGHAFKLTGDLGVAFDEVSGAWGGGSRGWQGDDAGAGSQFLFRAQLQALF